MPEHKEFVQIFISNMPPKIMSIHKTFFKFYALFLHHVYAKTQDILPKIDLTFRDNTAFEMGSVHGIVAYQDTNFGGQSVTLGTGKHNGGSSYSSNKLFPKSNKFKKDDVSSLKVQPGYGCLLRTDDGSTLKFVNARPSYDTVNMDVPTLNEYTQKGHSFDKKVSEITVFESSESDDHKACHEISETGEGTNTFRSDIDLGCDENPEYEEYVNGNKSEEEVQRLALSQMLGKELTDDEFKALMSEVDADNEALMAMFGEGGDQDDEQVTENFGCRKRGSYITPCIVMAILVIILLAIIWYVVWRIDKRIKCIPNFVDQQQ